MKPITEVGDIVNKVQEIALDVNKYYLHMTDNTVDAYYQEVLTQVVTDMAVLPLERVLADVGPIEDANEIQDGFVKIIYTLSDLFGKDPKQVSIDLSLVLNKFPLNDVRQSTFLRHKGRLN